MELTESTAKQELPACPVETTLTQQSRRATSAFRA